MDNILIGNDFKLKLCDLGFARRIDKQLLKKYGTEGYMAPEVIMKDRYDVYEGVQADIFSLGVILFILYFGAPPFSRADPRNDRFYSLLSKKPESFFRLHPTIKRVQSELNIATVDADLIDLLTVLLSQDLSVRPRTIDDVLGHKFFAQAQYEDGSMSASVRFESLV